MSHNLITDIALATIFSGIGAVLMRLFKQPLIIGYILAGIILGPGMGLGWIKSREEIELISEIGLIFLLFIIGLEINLKEMIFSGRNIIILGFSQSIIGFILMYFLFKSTFFSYFSPLELIYLAFCLNLTSTLIVVKILKDKFEVQTLSGKLTIGILIMQDFMAILFLAFQKDFLNPDYFLFLKSLFTTLLLLIFSYGFSRYILSGILHKNSGNIEFVIIIVIAYCFFVSGLASFLGVSKEMGALIAGISISASPYSEEVIVRISSIRDFFVTLFFVSLGLKLPSVAYNDFVWSYFIIIVIFLTRFLSIIPYYKALKLGVRPLFITSINLFPVSEFSLVISSIGIGYGHISEKIVVILILTMILSSIISTYLINYNHSIYSFFSKILKLNEIDEKISTSNQDVDILILGYNRITAELLKILKEKNPLLKVLVADFNAGNAKFISMVGGKWTYSDFSNYTSLLRLSKYNPSIIISPLSNITLKGIDNYTLLLNIKSIFPSIPSLFVVETEEEEEKLSKIGTKVVNISKISSKQFLREIRRIYKMKEKNFV